MVSNNAQTDVVRNLRDKSVPYGSSSVHPIGNPMSHSGNVGFMGPVVGGDPS